MKILLTGHLGFVGQHLIKRLEKDFDLMGFDLRNGQDIRNSQQLDLFFEQHQPEVVIHLAALAGVRQGEAYSQEYYSTNVLGTQNVVNMCIRYGVKHLINFSSSSVFGGDKPPVKEDDLKTPRGVYGISKLTAEYICRAAKAIPQVTTIRPFTIYGLQGRPEQVFYKWINQIKKDGVITKYGDGRKSCRGYIYVDDLISGILKIIQQKGKWQYEDFNLGGHEVVYLNELEKIFREFVPQNFKVKNFDLPAVDPIGDYANIGKAKKMLGFDPPKNFRNNLQKIIATEFDTDQFV